MVEESSHDDMTNAEKVSELLYIIQMNSLKLLPNDLVDFLPSPTIRKAVKDNEENRVFFCSLSNQKNCNESKNLCFPTKKVKLWFNYLMSY